MKKHGTADGVKEVKGWTWGQIGQIIPIFITALTTAFSKVLEGRDPKSVIEKLGRSGERLTRGIVKLIKEILDSFVFLLTLEGSHLASELIKRGKYDWFNDWITNERFPLLKHDPVEREIEFVEFDFDPESEDVLKEFEKRGLDRPTYEDALYFGIEYPEEQRKRPIVFLHEPVADPGGDRYVLVLRGRGGRRLLDLICFDGRWDRSYVFAGVRKK